MFEQVVVVIVCQVWFFDLDQVLVGVIGVGYYFDLGYFVVVFVLYYGNFGLLCEWLEECYFLGFLFGVVVVDYYQVIIGLDWCEVVECQQDGVEQDVVRKNWV